MGVLGLWQILESVGHPVKLDGLEGKRLGVDANVWLYKFIRGFREKETGTSLESHKLGLFNRISKLLYYKIKPVFVFDGPAPTLKRKTLEKRQDLRVKNLSKVQDAAMRALAEQLKKQYPDANIDQLKIHLPEFRSNGLVAAEKLTDEDRDLFYLPPETVKLEESDDSEPEIFFKQEYQHPSRIDIHSKDFESLPPEIRYEILHDIKSQKRRVNPEALPEDPNSFSNFQLKRLQARRLVQAKIEKCEQDICQEVSPLVIQNIPHDPIDKPAEEQATSSCMRASQSTSSHHVEMEQRTLEKQQDVGLKNVSNVQDVAMRPLVEQSEKQYLDANIDQLKIHPQELRPDGLAAAEKLEDEGRNLTVELLESSDSDESDGSEPEILFTQIEKCDQDICQEESLQVIQNISHDPVDTPAEEQATSSYERSPQPIQSQHVEMERKTPEEQQDGEVEDSSKVQDDEMQASAEKPEKQYPDANIDQPRIRLPELRSDDLVADEKLKDEDRNLTVVLEESDDSEPEISIKQIEERGQDTRQEVSPPVIQNIPHNPIDKPAEEQATSSSYERPSQPVQSQHVEMSGTTTTHSTLAATKKVTTRIVEEAKELLRLFGVPYIDAAGEAEAQCALLEELSLTDGTITDDSDVWLFGAQNVYRYFFSDDKYVMQYKLKDINFHLRLSRENMVCFAMLVGSDYTDGIMNVGPVTALEILSEFQGDGLEPLLKFKEWRENYSKAEDKKVGNRTRKKLLKYRIPDEFPSRTVFEGYLKPAADTSSEKFTWGTPELDELRIYAQRNFGWDLKKTDEKLLPVLKRMNERRNQMTIDSFFFKTAANQNPEMFRSKRVNQALNKIAIKRDEPSAPVDEVVCLSELSDFSEAEEESRGQQVRTANQAKSRGNKRTTTNKKTSTPTTTTTTTRKKKVTKKSRTQAATARGATKKKASRGRAHDDDDHNDDEEEEDELFPPSPPRTGRSKRRKS